MLRRETIKTLSRNTFLDLLCSGSVQRVSSSSERTSNKRRACCTRCEQEIAPGQGEQWQYLSAYTQRHATMYLCSRCDAEWLPTIKAYEKEDAKIERERKKREDERTREKAIEAARVPLQFPSPDLCAYCSKELPPIAKRSGNLCFIVHVEYHRVWDDHEKHLVRLWACCADHATLIHNAPVVVSLQF